MNLSGRASHWYQAHKDTYGVQSWEQFEQSVLSEFEVNTHRDKMMELLTLKQVDSVADYKKQFEQLVYHIKLFDKTVSETLLVSQFVLGLKDELRPTVEMQLPDTMTKAATLAAVQESLLRRNRKSFTKSPSSKAVSPPAKLDTTSQFSAGELWKARQLREFRKQNGLCYKR